MLSKDIDHSMMMGKRYLNSNSAKEYMEGLQHAESLLTPVISSYNEIIVTRKHFSRISSLENTYTQRVKDIFIRIKDDLEEEDVKSVINDIEDIKHTLIQERSELERKWQNYRNTNLNANANLISALKNVIDDDTAMDELDGLKAKIYGRSIGDDKTINLVAEYVEKSRDLIKSLSMKKEVESFVVRIANGDDVTLDDISDDTWEWIKKHGLLKKIKVVI